MNDSLRTNVFVRFQAETIACACIYLAARALQVSRNVYLKRFSTLPQMFILFVLVSVGSHKIIFIYVV